MRISSSLYFQTGLNTINKQESDLMHLFQQIGSGRRMVSPADDPLAAAQTITLAQSHSINQRFSDNREVALRALGEKENVLNHVVTQLAAIKTRFVEAGNGALSDKDRSALAQVLKESQATLMGSMNATDASGKYLFSGSKGQDQPFSLSNGVYKYLGDTGEGAQRNIQVDHTRFINVGDHGQDVLFRSAPGALAFVHGGTEQNEGQIVVGSMQVQNSALAIQVKNIDLEFIDNGIEPAHWQVVVSYASEQGEQQTLERSLHFPAEQGHPTRIDLREEFGVAFDLNGQAVHGDSLNYQQAKYLNGADELNILNTLSEVIQALNTPTKANPTAQAQLENTLNRGLQLVDLAYDNVLTVQASIGSRMNELESLDESGAQQFLQLEKELSRLEDVDYYTATTQLQLRKMALEAASMAFLKIQSSSLFSMGN